MQYVPVVSSISKPLMPCHAARARQLVNKGRAVGRFNKGIYYIQLLDRADGEIQPIAVGVDPGSKREGFTVKSAAHTYLNLQAEAVDWVGKRWFYEQVSQLADLRIFKGYETATLRQGMGLKKSGQKLSTQWDAHCVDSFVLANAVVGGHVAPDNKAMLILVPLQLHRRALHRANPQKGGIRPPYGGTKSLGFKRGSWVKHPTWGVCYVGGTSKGCISLHSLTTGKRLTQRANPKDCRFLCYASWRVFHA